jgi:hypothetical protein
MLMEQMLETLSALATAQLRVLLLEYLKGSKLAKRLVLEWATPLGMLSARSWEQQSGPALG